MKSLCGPSAVLLAVCLAAGVGTAQYLVDTIPTGDTPTAVLWNPLSNKVYVANFQDASVTIVDGATNQVLATVGVPDYPRILALNSCLNKVYCTSGESNTLAVIDGVGDSVLAVRTLAGYPARMAFNSTMNKLYVSCIENGRLAVLDGTSDLLLRSVVVGWDVPADVIWQPVANVLFCSDGTYDSVKVVDCSTDEVIVRTCVPTSPDGLCWSPVNNLVYVGGWEAIVALSADGDSIVATMPAQPGYTNYTCFVPFPNKVYISGGRSYAVDCNTNTATRIMGVWGQPVCDTIAGKVYVSSTGGGVYIYDARADTIVGGIGLGWAPFAVAWNWRNRKVYVTDLTGNAVYAITDTSSGIADGVPSPLASSCPATTVSRGFIYVRAAGGAMLLDISGRPRARLRPGRNDVSRLPAGVYFLSAGECGPGHKVVLYR